jgi:hypothetical protein
MPAIPATQKAEIQRTEVQEPAQAKKLAEFPFQQKLGVWWFIPVMPALWEA